MKNRDNSMSMSSKGGTTGASGNSHAESNSGDVDLFGMIFSGTGASAAPSLSPPTTPIFLSFLIILTLYITITNQDGQLSIPFLILL